LCNSRDKRRFLEVFRKLDMDKEELKKLKAIAKDISLNETLKKLFTKKNLEYDEKSYILACAILFLKAYEKDRRFTTYENFAYYIILKYSLTYEDYDALYNFSVNFGFYPIAKMLLREGLVKKRLEDVFIDLKIDEFKNNKGYIETLEQFRNSHDFLEDSSLERAYIAPTSFGKSAIIVDYIEKNSDIDAKIVIIVPTKSLLMQTQKMIRKAKIKKKIIVHDEMYNGEKSFVAIFTQERALRLLQKDNKIYFDNIVIDEAHNIFETERGVLLSRLIFLNKARNNRQKIIYLSPLIENINNIKLDTGQEIKSYNIEFNIKEPEIFEYTSSKKIFQYNRFFDDFYEVGECDGIFDYLKKNSKEKNFIYSLRPIDIENFAGILCSQLENQDISEKILEIQNILKREVHEDFYVIRYLAHGVIYLHGKMPDLIKEYLEEKFKTLPELKYVIANSVILEGINFPIDTLFILRTYMLNGKKLINLIGRVNRLDQIFSKDNVSLDKLLPKVHFINNREIESNDMRNKIKLLRSNVVKDKINNPMLAAFDLDNIKNKNTRKKTEKTKKNEEFLNLNCSSPHDKVKQYLINSNIIYLYGDEEKLINVLLDRIENIKKNVSIWNKLGLLDKIHFLFIKGIEDNISDMEFKRLEEEKARKYYENYIKLNRKKTLKRNIEDLYAYYNEKIKRTEDTLMYIGKSYGKVFRDSSYYDKNRKLEKVYIDLSKTSKEELINIIVVKIKLEEDFIGNTFNKFVTMMYDYELISKDEYNLYIYGTNDKQTIDLIKYGLSINLIERLKSANQLKNLCFDEFGNLRANENFNLFIEKLDDFHKFEINRYLN